ncbi:MAG: hypothetical protein NTY48_03120, partial [Candidatus Diapherotrites archaeon]|nr:hypothetical protein [Candidatus Diapherotrites archaeon]
EVINRLAGTELIKKVKWKLGPFGKPCVYYYVDLTVKPFLHKENNFVYRYFVCSNLHNEYEDKIKLFLNKYSEENRQLFGYQLRLSFDIAAKRHFSRKVVNKLLSSKTKLDEAKLFWVPTKKKESENGKTEPILRNDVERIHSRFTDLLSSPEEFVSKKSKDTHWKIYYYVFYPFLKTILNEKSSHFKFKYLMGFKFEELGFSSFEKQKQEFLNLFNAPYNSAIKRIRRSSIHTSLDSKTGELKYRVDKKRLYNSMILNKH